MLALEPTDARHMIRRLAIALALGLALPTGADAGTLSLMGAGPGAAGSACADPNWSSVVLLAFNDDAATGTTTFVDSLCPPTRCH